MIEFTSQFNKKIEIDEEEREYIDIWWNEWINWNYKYINNNWQICSRIDTQTYSYLQSSGLAISNSTLTTMNTDASKIYLGWLYGSGYPPKVTMFVIS